MGRNEKSFERKCMKILRDIPKTFWHMKIEHNSIRGIPDRIGCVNGIYCALEFKANDKELYDPRTKLQGYVLSLVEDAGGYARFVTPTNWEEVLREIKGLTLL